jgi:hypothetical protein
MPHRTAQRLRNRALDCRNIAKGACSIVDAALLEEIADELDADAVKLELRRAADPTDHPVALAALPSE